MKKILIIASLALCCSLLASCEDFLDTKKYGAKTDWETQEDVEKALVALFSFNTNDSEGVTGRGITWFECCSDDMTVGRPQGEAEDIRNFRMSPSNGRDVKNNWKIMYEVNAKANNIIKVVPTMNLDNAFKTKATGTAYFFRGFAMLWLSPYYGDNGPNGGIPIILDTTEPAAMDSPRPASVLQNYDQIISDLREAGKRLPLFSQLAPEEYGMPHKAAAWALAARAALYAAQFDAKYYDTVIEMCDKVMGLTGADKRELFDDGTDKAFANLWRKQQNFGCEYIFSLLGNAVDGPKFHGMSFQNGGWGLYNHWGYFQPENSPATKAELKNQRRCELAFEFMPSRHLDMVRWGDAKETYAKPTQRVNSHWDYDLQQVVIDAPSNYDNGRTFDPVINQVFPIPVTAFNGTVNLTQNQGY